MLKINWKWVDIVKPPQVRTIPDILTPAEIENPIDANRKRVHIRRGKGHKDRLVPLRTLLCRACVNSGANTVIHIIVPQWNIGSVEKIQRLWLPS